MAPLRDDFKLSRGRPLTGTVVGSDPIDLHAQLVTRRIGVDSQPVNIRGSSAALPVAGRRGLIKIGPGNLAEALVTDMTGNSRSLVCCR